MDDVTDVDASESNLSRFLNALQPPDTVPDYAILFQGVAIAGRGRTQKPKQSQNSSASLTKLFTSSSIDINDEVEKCYFENLEFENSNHEKHDLEFDSVELSTNNNNNNVRGEKWKDDESVLHWTGYIEASNVDTENLEKLLKIEDDAFKAVMINCKNIPMEVVEKVIQFATGKSCEFLSQAKLVALAEYGLLPKMCQPNVVLRNVIPSYKNLLAADASVIVKHLLMPMIKNKIAIARPLLTGVDKEMLFSLTMAWMDEESLELSLNTINTLNELLQWKKQLTEYICDILIKTLEHSVRYKPKDKDIAFFFRFIIDRFGWNMQEEQLKRLQVISNVIQTNLKDSIQTLIQDKLNSLTM